MGSDEHKRTQLSQRYAITKLNPIYFSILNLVMETSACKED